ncbi:hypothetical protein M427DRAFT_150799, partial [Gonapodya prolifera JEL478]
MQIPGAFSLLSIGYVIPLRGPTPCISIPARSHPTTCPSAFSPLPTAMPASIPPTPHPTLLCFGHPNERPRPRNIRGTLSSILPTPTPTPSNSSTSPSHPPRRAPKPFLGTPFDPTPQPLANLPRSR